MVTLAFEMVYERGMPRLHQVSREENDSPLVEMMYGLLFGDWQATNPDPLTFAGRCLAELAHASCESLALHYVDAYSGDYYNELLMFTRNGVLLAVPMDGES